MNEFLKSIGITNKGRYTDKDTYIVDINDSNEHAKIYSRLIKNSDINEIEEASQMTENDSTFQFESDEYLITLLADYDNDLYSLTIIER